MKNDLNIITKDLHSKLVKSIAILNASLNKLTPYNPLRRYLPDESEPFDALSDRFIRAVELSHKFFKSYERLIFGETSDTLRDLLNKMEKINMISSVKLWIEMKNVRNRIVHDYLPEELKEIYDDIMFNYSKELNNLIKIELATNI